MKDKQNEWSFTFRFWWVLAGLSIMLLISGIQSHYSFEDAKQIYQKDAKNWSSSNRLIGAFALSLGEVGSMLMIIFSGLIAFFSFIVWWHVDDCQFLWKNKIQKVKSV